MNKLVTTNTGGLPIVLDDLRWNDNAYREAMTIILRAFGDNFIVQGCTVNGVNISAGYVMLNGELLKVDAHEMSAGYFQKQITYNAAGLKTFKNGTSVNTYEQNRAVVGANEGNLGYNGTRYANVIATALINILKASAQQVLDSLLDNVFITPLSLNGKVASDSVAGLLEIATNNEFKNKTINNRAIVPSNFNQAWDSFQLVADDNDVTMVSSSVRYLKLGRIVLMNVIAQFNVTGSPGNGSYVRLRENGTDYEELRPSAESACGCKLYNPSSGFETGNVVIYDVSIATDRFLFDIRRRDGSNFTVANSYNIAFNIVYNSFDF